ncbi:MAG: hypothetical protein Q9182_005758 [Xanthomendoza sp. 2 TL-2023]
MGQESSTLVDESTPPQTLNARTIDAVATYISEARAKKVVLMVSLIMSDPCPKSNGVQLIMVETGAGISTSAGIPDFRSPDTGIYANLAKLNLPYPQAVFGSYRRPSPFESMLIWRRIDISYFRSNPLPFYTLARELYPGQYNPTISHCFMRLLSDKGLLLKLFTQNIDCLERAVGVPDDKIVEAHGSFAHQRCIDCRTEYPDDLMKQAIHRCEVPRCTQADCEGLVKPDIVFFGEALPEEFHRNRGLPGSADLAIIMGTSLTVQPFASLPGSCSVGVPRLLLNSERVGGLGSRADDVLVLGDCDEGVRKLASALGWQAELEALFKVHNPDVSLKELSDEDNEPHPKALDDEIAKITKEIDDSLRISDRHAASVSDDLLLPGRTSSQPSTSTVSKDETNVQNPPVSETRESDAEQRSNMKNSQPPPPTTNVGAASDAFPAVSGRQ